MLPGGSTYASDGSPANAAQKVSQGGQMIASALHAVAELIRSHGKNWVQTIGGLFAQFAGPQFGPIITGVLDVFSAISGSKGKKLQAEITNEPTVHIPEMLSYVPGANPASAQNRGDYVTSGAANGSLIKIIQQVKGDLNSIIDTKIEPRLASNQRLAFEHGGA